MGGAGGAPSSNWVGTAGGDSASTGEEAARLEMGQSLLLA